MTETKTSCPLHSGIMSIAVNDDVVRWRGIEIKGNGGHDCKLQRLHFHPFLETFHIRPLFCKNIGSQKNYKIIWSLSSYSSGTAKIWRALKSMEMTMTVNQYIYIYIYMAAYTNFPYFLRPLPICLHSGAWKAKKK